MSELTISNLIKIIIGIVVVGVVIVGLVFFFRNNINDFFNNILGGDKTEIPNLILSLVK